MSDPKTYATMAAEHEQAAQEAINEKDFLAARMHFIKATQALKNAGEEYSDHLELLTKEYEEFARHDPTLARILKLVIPHIQNNQGILQSTLAKGLHGSDSWPALYNYDHPLAKDDLYYSLYFGEKFGLITRKKKGRSYELTIPEEAENTSSQESHDKAPVAIMSEKKQCAKPEKLEQLYSSTNQLPAPNPHLKKAFDWYAAQASLPVNTEFRNELCSLMQKYENDPRAKSLCVKEKMLEIGYDFDWQEGKDIFKADGKRGTFNQLCELFSGCVSGLANHYSQLERAERTANTAPYFLLRGGPTIEPCPLHAEDFDRIFPVGDSYLEEKPLRRVPACLCHIRQVTKRECHRRLGGKEPPPLPVKKPAQKSDSEIKDADTPAKQGCGCLVLLVALLAIAAFI